MAITTGASLSVVSGPAVPGQAAAIVPVLQAQDGSFVGTVGVGPNPNSVTEHNMIAFDASGNVRWSVPGNYAPKIATADGGVIAQAWDEDAFDFTGAVVMFDQYGNATGQMDSLPIHSWRGNIYQQGSVERLMMASLFMAQSLWAQSGANPSGNTTATRPWYFAISFENDFMFTPEYPNMLTALTTSIANRALLIKIAALTSFWDAYSGVPVTVLEGNRGDAVVHVVNHQTLVNQPDCGASVGSTRQVDYAMNMAGAQDAYHLTINNTQDMITALAQRLDVIQAIGRGIGFTAAHETAHKFLNLCCTMDANPQVDPAARGAINAKGCSGLIDPSIWIGYWPTPRIDLHWEDPARTALTQCLAKGWRDFAGSTCHN